MEECVMTSLRSKRTAPKPSEHRRAATALPHPKSTQPFALCESGKKPAITPNQEFSEAILEWLDEEDYL